MFFFNIMYYCHILLSTDLGSFSLSLISNSLSTPMQLAVLTLGAFSFLQACNRMDQMIFHVDEYCIAQFLAKFFHCLSENIVLVISSPTCKFPKESSSMVNLVGFHPSTSSLNGSLSKFMQVFFQLKHWKITLEVPCSSR